MQGRVYSTESFGAADGPGVRFVIFLQGCTMRCRYCHNADTWALDGGELRSADELLDEAERFRSYWGSEGGITVSGGEALLQMDFLLELFAKAKQRNIGTCLDSSLAPFTRARPWLDAFDQLMSMTDVVLADIKHIDPVRHRWLCGHDNSNILDGIRHLDELGVPVWIRQVLVPGITDDDDALRRTRAFIASLGNVERIEVLPYHTMGAFKWKDLGIPYPLEGVEPPTSEQVRHAERILRGEEPVQRPSRQAAEALSATA